MCGIAGFIGNGELADLKRMNAALVHRGPDAEGFWQAPDTAVYLAHRRLSIIDLRDGRQPMLSSDGRLCVTFNGEIYNHRELRSELEQHGHVFHTDHADTEVLLYGYRQWGEALPDKLNGMWAFAIYDKTAQRLFLSRDRFGKKPLFYTVQNGTFAFASELSALAKHSAVRTSISPLSLKKYFAYGFIPAPGSLCTGIYKLPAGCNLELDVKTMAPVVRQYWRYEEAPLDVLPANPEETWGEELRSLIDQAVARRLMADVPLGVFLSGGIDSSAVTAFAARHAPEGTLKTFSIGFDETSFDESQYARSMANCLHTDHYFKILNMDMAQDLLPDIMAGLDEPLGDSSLLPTYLLCRETKKVVTVALGGDGADELFCGYDPFRALALAERYAACVPRLLHKGIRMLAGCLPVSHKNISFDFKIKRALLGLSYPKKLWNPVWLAPLGPDEMDGLFREKTDIEEVYAEAIECWDACTQKNIVDKTSQFYIRMYLQNGILTKVDRASMLNSLEVRAPYLDIDLVDFARTIPSRYKLRHGTTKYILKKALEPILPRRIIGRAKKGFGAPVGRWFKEGGLRFDGSGVATGLSDVFINTKISEHKSGTHDHRLFLWNLWTMNNSIPKYFC